LLKIWEAVDRKNRTSAVEGEEEEEEEIFSSSLCRIIAFIC
jgi:hypothetical protein